MTRLNDREKGLEEFVSAMNTTLPRDVMNAVGARIKALQAVKLDDHPITNRALIAMYQVLFDKTQLEPRAGKPQFNRIQTKWVDNVIKGHEKEMFSESLLTTLVNYNNLVNGGSEILVEPDGQGLSQGVRIEMKDGCMYRPFCDYTGNRKCIRGTAIKHIVNYFHPEPYQFLLEKSETLTPCVLLERPEGTPSCIIRAVQNISASDIIEEYRKNNQSITLL